MSDLEQQLENAIEPTQEQEAQVEENTQAIEQDKAPAEVQEEVQELWKQSNQYKQGLWKTPDDIMNSVHYYERKFQPLEQTIKRMGFKELTEVEQAFKDYQEKLPVFQENEQTINLLNALLQHDQYGSKIRGVFDEIRRSQEMERYGMAFDELPAVIREKVAKGEQAFQQLEEMKAQQAESQALTTIQEQIGRVEKLAEQYGFEVDVPELIKYCQENNINPANIYGEFLTNNFADLVEKAKQNASFATTVQNKQNKQKAVNTSTKQGTNSPKAINSFKDLESALLEKI